MSTEPIGAILLVDDDETVLEFGAMALSMLGRPILSAEDAAQCLALVAQHGDAIALIVLDMQMPDLNGDVVLQKLREAGNDMPILLCSGYELTEPQVRALGATAFQCKPYRMRELAETCRRLLGDEE